MIQKSTVSLNFLYGTVTPQHCDRDTGSLRSVYTFGKQNCSNHPKKVNYDAGNCDNVR